MAPDTPAEPLLSATALAVDQVLAELVQAYDFLLQVTPLNLDDAWVSFQQGGFSAVPDFVYREPTVDVEALRRRASGVRLDGVEDAALVALLSDKLAEIDGQLAMLAARNTPSFLAGSVRAFGSPDAALLETATALAEGVAPKSAASGTKLTPEEFAAAAREQLRLYRQQVPDLPARVEVRDDVAGLIVSRGHLLVGSRMTFNPARVEAQLAHEVGTHIVTYYNGAAQPLALMRIGLAGFAELQEGLAVLSEYLVGGFDVGRLRLLALRVIAAHALVESATFLECFQRLRAFQAEPREAYNVTARIYRGGGLTKDAVYLRGLVRLLEHLHRAPEAASPLERVRELSVGKLSFEHLPQVDELRMRGILRPPVLTPLYLEQTQVAARLTALRDGIGVAGLLAPTIA